MRDTRRPGDDSLPTVKASCALLSSVASHLTSLSAADLRLIDQACDQFEEAWKAGRRPRLEEYVTSAGDPVRPALVRQLLLLDWDYRRGAGERPVPAEYHSRLPEYANLIDSAYRELAGAGDAPATPVGERATEPVEAEDRYQLGEEIGRGGMGVVYRGRDSLLGRELAVKVLRTTYRDRPDAHRRFVAEARVGSQLQHPAIVPVYDLGRFGDRRPYMTMKLVEGHTLAALLRERGDPGEDVSRLLGIFEHVCQAIAYAHARGVVHRDLKPANVMVGEFGEVQVMDWGFAKILTADGTAKDVSATDESDFRPVPIRAGDTPNGVTHSGTLMGTPPYMPPEQAWGNSALIDRRADVFALGAILCEILTGKPAYVGASAEEVCAKAAKGDLADAHSRLDACGAGAALRDLAKRCLASDRFARPPDAGVVARDLTAYLASAQERLRKSQLEQAAAEASAAQAGAKVKAERLARKCLLALAAALLVGGAAAAWQAVVATRAKQDALAAAAAQQEAKETADAKEAETRAVLEFVQNRIVAAHRPKGEPGGLGKDVTLREALEAALPAVSKSFADQPLVEARLRMTLGVSFASLSEPKIAAQQYTRAREIFTERLGPNHRDTLAAMNNLSMTYTAQGRPADAVQLQEETLALRQAYLGPDDPDTLISINNLAVGYNLVGRGADALALREQAVPLFHSRLGPDHRHTLALMANLAGSYYSEGRYADAVKLFEETLERQKIKPGPEHSDTLMTMTNLAAGYKALGRHTDALKIEEGVLALRRARLGPTHRHTLLSMSNIGSTYQSLGRHEEAFKLCEEVLALRKTHLGPLHEDTLQSLYNLGSGHAYLKRFEEAVKVHEEALTGRQARLGPKHPDTLESMLAVAAATASAGRSADAVPIIDDCVRRAAGQRVPPRLYVELLDVRLRHYQLASDAAGCRATAEMWEKLGRTDMPGLYAAARYRAVTTAVLRATDPKSADAEADRAMDWLRKASAAGMTDTVTVAKDKDFEPLRERPDFRALVTRLED
jgi:tetratricopeptide (TPR) repeat protein/tRNA A-37 threonylcarbamoyl transferase component Bud32